MSPNALPTNLERKTLTCGSHGAVFRSRRALVHITAPQPVSSWVVGRFLYQKSSGFGTMLCTLHHRVLLLECCVSISTFQNNARSTALEGHAIKNTAGHPSPSTGSREQLITEMINLVGIVLLQYCPYDILYLINHPLFVYFHAKFFNIV